MRISDWSSDVCSSDLSGRDQHRAVVARAGDAVANHRDRARQQAVLSADRVDRTAAPPRLRSSRSVVVEERLLRRVDHAGRNNPPNHQATDRHLTVTFLRTDRTYSATLG